VEQERLSTKEQDRLSTIQKRTMDEQYQHYIAMQQSPTTLKSTQSMGEIDTVYGLRKTSMF
jgi:hypothetical protein